MVGLDYKESCNETECPFVQVCRRSFYERTNCNKDARENELNWYWVFIIF
jgi:hypothetical protein